MTPTDSPAVVPQTTERWFRGYSYVAPSVLFGETVLSDTFQRSDRPHTPGLMHASLTKSSAFFAKYSLDLDVPQLGDGSYSVCRRCTNKTTRQQFAVKILPCNVDCSREVKLLQLAQGHPNIVELVEVLHDDSYTYIVQELLEGGELLSTIRKCSALSELQTASIVRQLASAVKHLHSKGIVHRDLKPEVGSLLLNL